MTNADAPSSDPGRFHLDTFRRDVLAGLAGTPRCIPSKYFYDERGSRLFDAITRTPEYYPTRAEQAIMEAHVGEMAAAIGPRAVLVEYGSGSSIKTRTLLDALPDLAAYVPIDISREHLLATAEALRDAYPGLVIEPVAADYTADFDLPALPLARRHVVYFPGSTIGNFGRSQASVFLEHAAEVAGSGGGLLIGIDLRKDRATLEAAYDDAAGFTASFNLNVLDRINRELGGTFDRDGFRHHAVWNEDESRVEMYLVSRREQTAAVAGVPFRFAEGETIHTENSYKYSVEGFAAMAARADFALRRSWTDPDERFAVLYFELDPAP